MHVVFFLTRRWLWMFLAAAIFVTDAPPADCQTSHTDPYGHTLQLPGTEPAPNRAAMTLSGLIDALRKGIGVLPPSEFVQTIQRRGVSFEVTASVVRQLQQARATPEIIQAARDNYRPVHATAAPPPVTPPPVAPSPAPAPATLFAQAKSLIEANRFSEAVPGLASACNAGIAEGCYYLGFILANGRGVSQDTPQAVAFYRKACDGGNAPACNNLGIMYKYGQGVSPNNAQAVELYRKACDGGNAPACSNLGRMYQDGKGVSPDNAQALELYRKACDGGAALGCTNLKNLQH
jgi:hypothetical protein